MIISTIVFTSCQDFLEQPAYGILSEDNIDGAKQIENLCISAYAGIGNEDINRPLSLWNYGNVRADDAYKGGNDQNDGEPLHFLEIASPSIANETWYNDVFWSSNYAAISRINFALRALNNIMRRKCLIRQPASQKCVSCADTCTLFKKLFSKWFRILLRICHRKILPILLTLH